MKYELECVVAGRVVINKQLSVIKGSKEYVLIPDDKGLLSSIKIIQKVKDPNNYMSKIEPGEGEVKMEITIGGSREEYLDFVREFQELESILSFATHGALLSINWDAPKREYIPENPDEEKRIAIRGIHMTKEYRDDPVRINLADFDLLIQNKDKYTSLIVPKAFYREGINAFHLRRYINAFYNFYFVLEDLYGQGETKNKKVANAFKNSTEFKEFLEWVKNYIDSDKRHQLNIRRFCNEEKVAYDLEGLIELLQKVRGNLHHYSSKSSKHLGLPFNHEDFESIAFLTMGLAVRTILQRTLEINRHAKAENTK